MNLDSSINIRLDPHVRKRLSSVAENLGVTTAMLIRQAISAKLDKLEKNEKEKISTASAQLFSADPMVSNPLF